MSRFGSGLGLVNKSEGYRVKGIKSQTDKESDGYRVKGIHSQKDVESKGYRVRGIQS